MQVEPQQRNAHPTEDHNGSMNLPTSVEERIKLALLGSPSPHFVVRSHCFNGIQKLGLSKVLFVVADEDGKTAILEAVADLPANIRSAVDVQLC